MTIPLDAIDPAAHSDRWRRSFEHHLDLIPPIIDAIVTMTVPHIPAARLSEKLTGGGVVDNMTPFLRGFDHTAPEIRASGAAADATLLWWWLSTFTAAVARNVHHSRPVPALPQRPDADPLTARSTALLTVGWLADHADQIEQLTVYESDIDEMFTEIRHLRGKYGVHATPRRPRARCSVCGTLSVVVSWVTAPNGSPKPIRAGKCRECGQTYAELAPPVDETLAASREVRSPACADLLHEMCTSVHCECGCHSLIRGEAA